MLLAESSPWRWKSNSHELIPQFRNYSLPNRFNGVTHTLAEGWVTHLASRFQQPNTF